MNQCEFMRQNMPKVSIIMNCYNGEEFLQETFDSLKNQSFADYEIIFWDNCSTDNSAVIAKKFDNRLKYYRGDELVSLGQARNYALEKCEGEYIAFVDCDDCWEPQKLERQLQVFEEKDSVGLVLTNFYRYNMLNGSKDVFNKKAEDTQYGFSDFVCQYDNFALSTFVFKKEILQKLDHWFDNTLKYAEEYDLFIRMAYYADAYYIKEPLATWRLHGTNQTIQLKNDIPREYEVTLANLRKMIPNLDEQFPEIVFRSNYLHDFTEAKVVLPLGENKKVRALMKPYVNYNIRAKVYYCVALLPKAISRSMYRMFYKKRI